jgi:eukaryotic-like serine/threonine-protein kinase
VKRPRWKLVEALFDAALERDAAERVRFVQETARGDEELAREVLSLLDAMDQEDDRFEEPAAAAFFAAAADAAADAASAMVGRRVGAYRLLREVGQGGMGTVYEAVRDDDQYHKRVAVKLIKRGMDSDLVVRRFRQERQILASLEHPNIAALLDGGLTDDGQPFFVLEYVEGEILTAYSADRNLSVQDRLRLFLELCDPVQYAHQNLVVHRDLKASNILVTAGGVPKLLDFGVAKLLRAADEGDVTMTVAGFHAFTPEYASPELIRGEAITTAADVYSLGVILYELLAGQRPFRFAHQSLPEVARIVGSQEPTRPSAAVAADRADRLGPDLTTSLRRELAGELDSIVLMAIAKDPKRRYPSVEALAEDVRRFLDGRPVLARQSTWAYRARKFIGRHRMGVAAAALLLLSLIGGVVATTSQARRAEAERVVAERRSREVRELANSLVFELHDAIAQLPGATAAREMLVRRSLTYLDRLYEEADDDPELQHELAGAYLRLGQVQGHPNHPNLGDLTGARASLGRALTLAQAVRDRDPSDRDARHTLAYIQETFGDVEAWTGDVADGVAFIRDAVANRRFVADARPEAVVPRGRLAVAMLKLGDLLGHGAFPNLGDTHGAMARYDTALYLLRTVHPDSAQLPSVRRYIGVLHERRGRMFEDEQRFEAALEELDVSRAIREQLAREAPDDVHIVRDAGIARERLCSVYLRQGDADRAVHHCQAAVDVFRRLEAADPEDVTSRATVAVGRRTLALAHDARGDHAAALDELRQSAHVLRLLFEADSTNTTLPRQLGSTLLRASAIHSRLADSPPPRPFSRGEHRRLAHQTFEHGRDLLVGAHADGELPARDRALITSSAAVLPPR